MSQTNPTQTPWRRIRSFVYRPGRLTSAQQNGLNVHLPRYQFDPQAPWFTHQAMVMEIGFGNGQALVEMAKAQPEAHIIGVEVHPPGVGRLLNALHAQDITNVSVAMCDAVALLEDHIPANSLDEVRIYFPDPWPKKRHHKRRLIQPEFVRLLAERLKAQGRLHLATDWMPYAEWMEEVMSASDAFDRHNGATHNRPNTHFQRRGERKCHPIVDMIYQRVGVS